MHGPGDDVVDDSSRFHVAAFDVLDFHKRVRGVADAFMVDRAVVKGASGFVAWSLAHLGSERNETKIRKKLKFHLRVYY